MRGCQKYGSDHFFFFLSQWPVVLFAPREVSPVDMELTGLAHLLHFAAFYAASFFY